MARQKRDLQSMLAKFYRDELDADGLCQRLKSGTDSMVKEAQLSLIDSLSLNYDSHAFDCRRKAICQLEHMKKNQRESTIERDLDRITEIRTAYREAMEKTLHEVIEKETHDSVPTIAPGRWITLHGTLSADTDLAERLAESQMQAESVYGERFATAVRGLRRLVAQDER